MRDAWQPLLLRREISARIVLVQALEDAGESVALGAMDDKLYLLRDAVQVMRADVVLIHAPFHA